MRYTLLYAGITTVSCCLCALSPSHLNVHPPHLNVRGIRRLDKAYDAIAKKPWILVDGNNVRAGTGWRYSAEDLTTTINCWAAENDLQNRVLTVWDGGIAACAFTLSNTAVLFSGDEQLADDLIVQAVGLLRGPVVLFSSDQGLRGRCHAQRDMQEESQRDDFAAQHSIYLAWMLEARDPSPRPVLGWATRREEAKQLSISLRDGGFGAGDTDDGDGDGDDRRRLRTIANWFNNPEPIGLSVERLTRHGNMLYAYNKSALGDELLSL